MPPAETLVI